MPNQRPAAPVYSGLQETSLNQTHFSKREIISPLIPQCDRAKFAIKAASQSR